MTLHDLGYTDHLQKLRESLNLSSFDIGRVTQEHKNRYTVRTDSDELDCELIGNLRYTATNRSELPAVGDWVALSPYDEGKGLIHAILPRTSLLERQAVGKFGESQIIASNIDFALIVQSVNRDFSINRLERYLTLCHGSNISPIIVVSKTDLMEESEVAELLSQIVKRVPNTPVVPLSNLTSRGLDQLTEHIIPGKTYCLLGSSGVGKSSLINSLSGETLMKTDSISDKIDRGKHVTTHRELIPLVNGAILIDNPGMREVGITDQSGGLETTFDRIIGLTENCKYSDCTHTSESGCAVLAALESGEIDEGSYHNYMRLQREKEHYESTVAEKRKKDKEFGKMIKRFKKGK